MLIAQQQRAAEHRRQQRTTTTTTTTTRGVPEGGAKVWWCCTVLAVLKWLEVVSDGPSRWSLSNLRGLLAAIRRNHRCSFGSGFMHFARSIRFHHVRGWVLSMRNSFDDDRILSEVTRWTSNGCSVAKSGKVWLYISLEDWNARAGFCDRS